MNSLLKPQKLWYRLHSSKSCLTNLSNEIKTASKNVHSITRTKRGKSNSSGFDREKAKKDIPQGSIINYDPDVKTDINGNHRTPRIGLSHELQHSSDVDKGIMSYENIGNGIPMREIRAINTENKIRKRTGDAKRTEYRGRKIPQKLLE